MNSQEQLIEEELELLDHKKLVERGRRLHVGGWPPRRMPADQERYYTEGVTREEMLTPEGVKHIRDRIREEERARREALKDLVSIVGGLLTPLIGLGGVIIGIISVSC